MKKRYLFEKTRKIVDRAVFRPYELKYVDRFLCKNSIFFKYLSQVDHSMLLTFQKIKNEESKIKKKEITVTTLAEQIKIRKKVYMDCKYILDKNVRKDFYRQLRNIKKEFHDIKNKYDDEKFNQLITNVRTEICKYKTSDVGA